MRTPEIFVTLFFILGPLVVARPMIFYHDEVPEMPPGVPFLSASRVVKDPGGTKRYEIDRPYQIQDDTVPLARQEISEGFKTLQNLDVSKETGLSSLNAVNTFKGPYPIQYREVDHSSEEYDQPHVLVMNNHPAGSDRNSGSSVGHDLRPISEVGPKPNKLTLLNFEGRKETLGGYALMHELTHSEGAAHLFQYPIQQTNDHDPFWRGRVAATSEAKINPVNEAPLKSAHDPLLQGFYADSITNYASNTMREGEMAPRSLQEASEKARYFQERRIEPGAEVMTGSLPLSTVNRPSYKDVQSMWAHRGLTREVEFPTKKTGPFSNLREQKQAKDVRALEQGKQKYALSWVKAERAKQSPDDLKQWDSIHKDLVDYINERHRIANLPPEQPRPSPFRVVKGVGSEDVTAGPAAGPAAAVPSSSSAGGSGGKGKKKLGAGQELGVQTPNPDVRPAQLQGDKLQPPTTSLRSQPVERTVEGRSPPDGRPPTKKPLVEMSSSNASPDHANRADLATPERKAAASEYVDTKTADGVRQRSLPVPSTASAGSPAKNAPTAESTPNAATTGRTAGVGSTTLTIKPKLVRANTLR